MYMGKEYAHQIFYDILGFSNARVIVDNDGYGIFSCKDGSVSIYVLEKEC